MPRIEGMGVDKILNSFVKHTKTGSNFSLILATKALEVQREQGAEAVKLINSASQIRTKVINIQA